MKREFDFGITKLYTEEGISVMTDYTKNFSLNLRDLRIRKNLTQKELADLLQYSEKTVSKWECGACVPDIDVLFKIANIFKVGVENPFTNSGTYYLGIDGGGTKKALALSDEEGNIIRTHKTEGCNPVDIGIDRVKEILKDAIYEICKDISLSSVYCFAGIAGGDSAGAISVHSAFDGRKNSQATKYVNIELTGNTPPYKGDEGTWNTTIEERFPSASHHQTVATEKGIRAFGTGFAFTEVSANILWALNKMLGSDVWVITLKTRLGLLESVLATLPDEQHIVGKSFGFEAKHPEIFEGNLVGQMGVYFSYETRDHTMFGALNQGYSKDFLKVLNMLFKGGICPHTVFEFPEDANKYPVILVPSPYKMLQSELDAMNTYISNGGKVIVCGPSAIPQCDSKWTLENKVPEGTKFFERNPERFNICYKWMNNFDFKPSADKDEWTTLVMVFSIIRTV